MTAPGSSSDGELPETYGHSRLVVMVVDPYHVHAYWEMTFADRMQARETLSPSNVEVPRWVLRFHDVTGSDQPAPRARSHFDIPVTVSARNWYVELWAPDKTYLVELGLLLGERFSGVCRSGLVRLPRVVPPKPVPETKPGAVVPALDALPSAPAPEPVRAPPRAQRFAPSEPGMEHPADLSAPTAPAWSSAERESFARERAVSEPANPPAPRDAWPSSAGSGGFSRAPRGSDG